MKFKYFLRGLGTGIIFASLVCIVAFYTSDPKEISDKEVIERAKMLGMVEKRDSVKDLMSSETKKISEESSEKDAGSNKETQTDDISSEITESGNEETSENELTTESQITETTSETTNEKTTEKQATEQTTENPMTDDEVKEDTKTIVSITIKGGMSSYSVCQQLQEYGMINDATDFDNYLIKNGYANRIRVGTLSLTIGMSYEEIAIAISDPR